MLVLYILDIYEKKEGMHVMWWSTFIKWHTSLQARKRISSSVKAIIEERRRKNNEGNSSSSSDNKRTSGDFLEILLCVDTLSLDEKVSFVLDSLLGGYETTSSLMAMVVHFLDQSPHALDQLKVTISIYFHICQILSLISQIKMQMKK